MNNYNIIFKDDFFILFGSVIFDNVFEIYNNSIVHFDKFNIIKIDLSELKIIDSSIFVLILSLIKKANCENKCIYFYNISQRIINLGKIYDFDVILFPYLR